MSIAIDIPRKRIYINCAHLDALDWISSRWDAADLIDCPLPILPGTLPLQACGDWSLEFGPCSSNQLDLI
jgi:hypothetical protein